VGVGRLPQVTIAHVTQGALQGHTNVQLELRLTQLYSVRARSACPDVLYSVVHRPIICQTQTAQKLHSSQEEVTPMGAGGR
jgi:hypothetical protein